jgi:hypothetical protein
MDAVIEITHYGANVTYVREATVSLWLAAAHLPPAIGRWNVAGKLGLASRCRGPDRVS